MHITFIGTGDAFGSGGRFQTCIKLADSGYTALVDCGATSLTAMKAQGVTPDDVDAVIVSHLHGDHFGGLPFLVLDGQFSRRTKPLTVLGPVGTASRLTAAMEVLYPGSASAPRRFETDVIELDGAGGVQNTGPMAVQGWEVDHACGAPPLAVRVDFGGSVIAYSGDTAWAPGLVQACAGSDVFVCEAYTFDTAVKYHLAYSEIKEHRDELLTRRLLLTHMGPTMLARLEDLDDEAAHDGLEVHA